jgi:large subunit ribosomal protein L9
MPLDPRFGDLEGGPHVKVVLKKEVKGLGTPGQIKDVSDGYAKNYLIPQGFATPATTAAVEQVEAQKAAQRRREAKEETDARKLAERLKTTPLVIRAKVGEQKRLYGSVTAADIADALGAALGQPFDKRKVELDEPIRTIGTHTVSVRVARNVDATVTVDVQPEAGG